MSAHWKRVISDAHVMDMVMGISVHYLPAINLAQLYGG
jgi:hypothetical protein